MMEGDVFQGHVPRRGGTLEKKKITWEALNQNVCPTQTRKGMNALPDRTFLIWKKKARAKANSVHLPLVSEKLLEPRSSCGKKRRQMAKGGGWQT